MRVSERKEKLKAWVEQNPQGYLEKNYIEIAREVGIAESLVRTYLLYMVAEHNGIDSGEANQKYNAAAKARRLMLKKNTVREKLKAWVERNPDGYLKLTFKRISQEAGVSEGSVNGHLTKIIADRDGILPSEVTAKRVAAGFRQSPLELPPEKVEEIRKLHNQDKHNVADISYITKCCEPTVRKYIQQD